MAVKEEMLMWSCRIVANDSVSYDDMLGALARFIRDLGSDNPSVMKLKPSPITGDGHVMEISATTEGGKKGETLAWLRDKFGAEFPNQIKQIA